MSPISPSTDNKIQTPREVEKTSTSGPGTMAMPFTFHDVSSATFTSAGNMVVNTGTTAFDADDAEISQDDKERFYKMTLRSDIL